MPATVSQSRTTRRRRLAVIVALAAVVVLVAALWPRPHSLNLTGMVTTDDVIVSSEIQGRLERLEVREGDQVRRGERIAEIQPPEYEADLDYYASAARQAQAAVAQAKADLDYQIAQTADQIQQAQANLASAQAQARAAAADLENARLTYLRQKELREHGTNSQQDFDSARTAWDGARARSLAAEQQADAAAAALKLAQASRDQVAVRQAALKAAADQATAAAAQRRKAQVMLGYTEIAAPISGIVDVRAARQGEVVAPAQAIVTLINPDDLWVRLDVEETYIDRVRLGEKLTVRLPSGAEREGVVFYRGVDADYATQRDVSRTKRDIKTFAIKVAIPNQGRRLFTGMTATVLLPAPPRKTWIQKL